MIKWDFHGLSKPQSLHAVKENSSSAAAPASQLKLSTTDLCVYGICLLVSKFPVASAFIYVQEFYSFVTPHRISKAVFGNNLKSSTVFKRQVAPASASSFLWCIQLRLRILQICSTPSNFQSCI